MKKICLIGNAGRGKMATDGQRIKVQTYQKVLAKEGFEVFFVELDNSKLRLLKILSDIKKNIRICDIVILITSDNGEKILVPYINRINKKYNKKFIFSHIGTSSLYHYIKDLNETQKTDFFFNHNFYGLVPNKRYRNQLNQINIILPETDLITNAYAKFYDLNNCITLTNFRLCEDRTFNPRLQNGDFKIIYLSRITSEKGIFDLIDVVSNLVQKGFNVTLDIYGDFQLSKEELIEFNSKMNSFIRYKGPLANNLAIQTISQYDLTCFPTRCKGEGVPGVIVESLLAGVPVLTSNFSQASQILIENKDSLFFEIYDPNSLKEKLEFLIKNPDILFSLKKEAFESGFKYSYDYSRDKLLALLK